MKPTIFEINTFDTTYAAYIRSRKMRDLLVNEGYRVIYSEANYQVENDSSRLRRNGTRTINTKNYPFAVLNITQSDGMVSFALATVKRLFYVSTLKYEILFLHQLSILTAPLILAAKIKGKKIVLDWDDLASAVQSSPWRSLLGRLAENPFVVRQTDLILSHNSLIIAEAKKMTKSPVEYITQGINTEHFNIKKYQKQSMVLKNKLNIVGKNVLIYAVSFNTGGVADLDIILAAMKIVVRENPNILLIILGGGPLLGKYQIKESPNIQFLGQVDHDKVPEYLSLADYGLVFMRDSTGNRMKMSLKTLEYLSMPIPVIGHLVGGTQKAVEKYIIESSSTSISLAKTIVQTIKKQIKKRPDSRKYIIDNFGVEVMEKQFLKALGKLT